MNNVKERSLLAIYLLGFFTFGLYFLYWDVSTKVEINELGGDIPTAFLIIIPIANLYWLYRYCEDFAKYVKKDDNAILYFVLFVFLPIIMPIIVQDELNKLAKGNLIENN
jgi:hypothetical protein